MLTTERFLTEADAFVLGTSSERHLTDDEDRIHWRIKNMNEKIYVVVNKQDTVTAGKRDRGDSVCSGQDDGLFLA